MLKETAKTGRQIKAGGMCKMIWSRTVFDGIVMGTIFASIVCLFWLIVPNGFVNMVPFDIRKAAPKRTKKEKTVVACFLYPLYLVIFAYGIINAYWAGISGFWNMFWTGYMEMFIVNLFDFVFINMIFIQVCKDKVMIKGTEHCKGWARKEWLLKLALPNHFILWPVVMCPLCGFVSAGIGVLIR